MSGEQTDKITKPSLQILTDLVMQEILHNFHISQTGMPANLFRLITYFPAKKFAELAYQIDQNVGQFGVHKASVCTLNRFVTRLDVRGYDSPSEGPLLVVANHPGGTDPFVLPAVIQRDDLRIVSLEHKILYALPHLYKNMVFLSEDRSNAHITIRNILQVLNEGKSIILYPGGELEPDPSLFPQGTHDYLQKWSKSTAFFLNRIPDLVLQPIIIRGTISYHAWKSIIAKFGTTLRARLQIAMIYQIAVQQIMKGAFPVQTTIIKGRPLRGYDLDRELRIEKIYHEIVSSMEDLLNSDPHNFPLIESIEYP